MHPKIHQAFEEIDAAIFSGDTFINAENIKELRRLMERWERGLKEHEACLYPEPADFADANVSLRDDLTDGGSEGE